MIEAIAAGLASLGAQIPGAVAANKAAKQDRFLTNISQVQTDADAKQAEQARLNAIANAANAKNAMKQKTLQYAIFAVAGIAVVAIVIAKLKK